MHQESTTIYTGESSAAEGFVSRPLTDDDLQQMAGIGLGGRGAGLPERHGYGVLKKTLVRSLVQGLSGSRNLCVARGCEPAR